MSKKIIIVGSGNAALCAGIAALEKGSQTLMIEKAGVEEGGGNSLYTAGAMRFTYNSGDELLPLLDDPQDQRLADTEFGSYTKEKFSTDLLMFNNGKPLSPQQQILIENSYDSLLWLAQHNIKFAPIYSRQTFKKDGKYIFWGGLVLEAQGEGVGLVEAELAEYLRLGGEIVYQTEARELLYEGGRVTGVKCLSEGIEKLFYSDAIILACGGFEADPEMRSQYMGAQWRDVKVRGTRHNTGQGLTMALAVGADLHGQTDGCHATPVDFDMPDHGDLSMPPIERKHYRKICYFLGIMLNAEGKRFVDEGLNFRNYTYAQFGGMVQAQPGGFAWQIFDSKTDGLLYDEYLPQYTKCLSAESLTELCAELDGVDAEAAGQTIEQYNLAAKDNINFDPTVLDGNRTTGLDIDKTNWAIPLDQPPFKAYRVSCGITFTFGGLRVNDEAAVLNAEGQIIDGLFACGELVGGVFFGGYPGGSGLTSGTVFGRLAGYGSSKT